MQTHQADYFSAYRNVKLTRDANGVLAAQLHTNDGPCIMTAQTHTEFVDAFYRISQDRANKIVILTGAGGEFITMSIGHLSATPPIPASGARFTTKAFRSWKTSPTYVCRSSRRSRDARMCIPTMCCSPM